MKKNYSKADIIVTVAVCLLFIGALIGTWRFCPQMLGLPAWEQMESVQYSEQQVGVILVIYAIVLGFFSWAVLSVVQFANTRIGMRSAARRAMGVHIFALRSKSARIAYNGLVSFFRENYRKAVKLLELAMKLTDDRDNVQFCLTWIIRAYDRLGDEEAALVSCKKSVELDPTSSFALIRLGERYEENGELDKAEYYFGEAVRYDPLSGYAYYWLGVTALRKGLFVKARGHFETSDKTQQGNAAVYAQLSFCCTALKDYDGMRKYYQLAVANVYKDIDELKKRIETQKDINAAAEASQNQRKDEQT